jgi:uncharacterized protein YggU (UPF0235/DUF167 family)
MPEDQERRLPLRITKTGIAITVRLTPGASADQIAGVETDADGAAFLKARVRAVPEKGKANAALVALVAKWLGVAKSSVEVTAGGSSRLKQLAITGAATDLADAFRRRLESVGNGEG